jgi:hypothetical protein
VADDALQIDGTALGERDRSRVRLVHPPGETDAGPFPQVPTALMRRIRKDDPDRSVHPAHRRRGRPLVSRRCRAPRDRPRPALGGGPSTSGGAAPRSHPRLRPGSHPGSGGGRVAPAPGRDSLPHPRHPGVRRRFRRSRLPLQSHRRHVGRQAGPRRLPLHLLGGGLPASGGRRPPSTGAACTRGSACTWTSCDRYGSPNRGLR